MIVPIVVGILVLLLVTLLTLFLLYTAYIGYVHNKYSHIPSPKLPSFYLGHVPDIIRLQKERNNPELPFADLCEYWMQKAGSNVVVIFFLHKATVYVSDPQVAKEIIMDVKNNKGDTFSGASSVYGERFLGNGLVTVPDYQTWKPRRKIYESSFNMGYLKTLVTNLNSLAENFLDELRPLADGKTTVAMVDHIHGYTMDVLGKVIFGTDFGIWDPKSLNITLSPEFKNPLSYVVNKVLMGVQEGFVSSNPELLQYLHPSKAKGYQEAVRAMRMMGRDCIQRRIKAIESGQETPNALKETHSIEDLVDDFCTFYVGGHETVANLMLFAIVEIHRHPDVLKRLKEEMREVVGDRTALTAEDLKKLIYMEQVLNETFRVHPILSILLRKLHSECTISGRYYPANTEFFLTYAVMCRMTEYYDQPEVFDPDRFNKKPDSFVFFPFGVGHRSCIGKHIAMMETKVLLTRLLQTYSITLPEGYESIEIQRITLQPKGKVPCVLKLID